MPRRADLANQRFGRLLVVSFAKARSGNAIWNCICDCGASVETAACHLKSGHTQSCGCFQKERALECKTKHGQSNAGGKYAMSKLYSVWSGMIRRCHNPKNVNFARYGGKGIAVCPRWRESFVCFAADMGEPPTPKHTLDRIDGNQGYAPTNCRWATMREQALNRVKRHGAAAIRT